MNDGGAVVSNRFKEGVARLRANADLDTLTSGPVCDSTTEDPAELGAAKRGPVPFRLRADTHNAGPP